MSKINIPNLIYSNKMCTKIIQEYNHFQYNTLVTTLLINESVFQSGKQRLNAPHTPLSGLSHWCCLIFLLNLLSLLLSSLCRRGKDILRRLYKERMIHFCKCWVNCTLSTRCLVKFIQLVINFTSMGHLTIMNSTRDIKKCNWDSSVGVKNKDRGHVVIVSPSIVELFLHIRFPALLEIKFKSIHCWPNIRQSRVSLGNGLRVLVYFLFRWNTNSSKRVITEHIRSSTMSLTILILCQIVLKYMS